MIVRTRIVYVYLYIYITLLVDSKTIACSPISCTIKVPPSGRIYKHIDLPTIYAHIYALIERFVKKRDPLTRLEM